MKGAYLNDENAKSVVFRPKMKGAYLNDENAISVAFRPQNERSLFER